jgi:glycosyltransferase involved in cell wall biosynthesis
MVYAPERSDHVDDVEPKPPMPLKVLINAMSASMGGSLTVARELTRHLAAVRPDWVITMLVTEGRPDHDEMALALDGTGVRVERAPSRTSSRITRLRWERSELASLVGRLGAHVAIQPNGIIPVDPGVPVFAHIGDPWPYVPVRDIWVYDTILAALRRRGHASAIRRAAAMGFTSHYMMQTVRNHFGRLPERSDVYYNGIPPAWIDRPAEDVVPLAQRRLEILSVSNVSRYKRQELVIKAMPLLRRMPGLERVRYRLVGFCDEKYRAVLERLVDRLGVRDAVSFEGRITDQAVREAYRSARCFTLPSLCESFGIPAIEAMSFGLPVVVARATAVPEICADAAEYAEADDLESLVGALARVLTDDARAQQLRQAGFVNIRRFDWTPSAEKLARTLETISA